MRRVWTLAFVSVLTCAGAQAALADQGLAAAPAVLAAADAKRFGDARVAAQRSGDKVLQDIVTWLDLLDRDAYDQFSTLADLLRRRPTWPAKATLQLRAEQLLTESGDQGAALGWFQANPPRTLAGALLHVEALRSARQEGEARAALATAWRTRGGDADAESQILARYGGWLTAADHAARLEQLLWDSNQKSAARRMLALVGGERRAVAEARLALDAGDRQAPRLLAAVPKGAVNDPGLQLIQARADRKGGSIRSAAGRALAAGAMQGAVAEAWWPERERIARALLDQGDPRLAYKVAAGHGLSDGVPQLEAEFLAGFIALEYSKDAGAASQHFSHLYRGATAPISKARGAYWAGRAALRAGDRANAAPWFQHAAEHPATYHGQLALLALNPKALLAPLADPAPTADDTRRVQSSDLSRAAALFAAAGDGRRVDMFLRRLTEEVNTPGAHTVVAQLGNRVGSPATAVRVAKRSAQTNAVLLASGYPVMNVRASEPEPAFVHAIIRQESEFDPQARSHAGALGLMQLMPGTAKLTAKRLSVSHDAGMLRSDPQHNILLGSSYLAQMIDRFGGSYILATAAYNAGPGNAQRWLEANGDPRGGHVDPVVWIERIGFYETRTYVQRVMEALQVYRSRLAGKPVALRLEADLRR